MDKSDEVAHDPLPEKGPIVADVVPSIHAVGHMDKNMEHYGKFGDGDNTLYEAEGFDSAELESVQVVSVIRIVHR